MFFQRAYDDGQKEVRKSMLSAIGPPFFFVLLCFLKQDSCCTETEGALNKQMRHGIGELRCCAYLCFTHRSCEKAMAACWRFFPLAFVFFPSVGGRPPNKHQAGDRQTNTRRATAKQTPGGRPPNKHQAGDRQTNTRRATAKRTPGGRPPNVNHRRATAKRTPPGGRPPNKHQAGDRQTHTTRRATAKQTPGGRPPNAY